MASSVSAPVAAVSQATKRTHAEMEIASSKDSSNQQSVPVQYSQPSDAKSANLSTEPTKPDSSESSRVPIPSNGNESSSNTKSDAKMGNESDSTSLPQISEDSLTVPTEAINDSSAANPSPSEEKSDTLKALAVGVEISGNASSSDVTVKASSDDKCTNKDTMSGDSLQVVPKNNMSPHSDLVSTANSTLAVANGTSQLVPQSMDTCALAENDMSKAPEDSNKTDNNNCDSKPNSSKTLLEDGEEPEKKAKLLSPSVSKGAGKTPEQILEYMDKTFDQRRKIITKQMPTIPELKEVYPDLFMGKQLLIEFQRITKIDIDQKIQEFCVRYATAVIEMARSKKGSAPVLARWEQAKQENETLKQYWDMVTALCLLPLHFGENFVEMVLEIGEDEEVVAQGKIVPTLVARGNIFRTDEFFLIAENTIVQEFEEFTIAFASLYSSYWVFNMVYPETIENTYNYIQRCIVRQREPGSIPTVCKNFTKSLQKWNKAKEGK